MIRSDLLLAISLISALQPGRLTTFISGAPEITSEKKKIEKCNKIGALVISRLPWPCLNPPVRFQCVCVMWTGQRWAHHLVLHAHQPQRRLSCAAKKKESDFNLLRHFHQPRSSQSVRRDDVTLHPLGIQSTAAAATAAVAALGSESPGGAPVVRVPLWERCINHSRLIPAALHLLQRLHHPLLDQACGLLHTGACLKSSLMRLLTAGFYLFLGSFFFCPLLAPVLMRCSVRVAGRGKDRRLAAACFSARLSLWWGKNLNKLVCRQPKCPLIAVCSSKL